MKNGWFIFVIFAISISYSEGGIREDFHRENPSKKHLLSMLDNDYLGNPSIILAYQGLCETMMAEFTFLPTSKMSMFKKGKEKVENTVLENPENCELRYIRLLIQINIPSFLNYNDEISEDFEYFVKNLHHQVPDCCWRKKFINNLLLGKHLNIQQKNQLLNMKSKIDETGTCSADR